VSGSDESQRIRNKLIFKLGLESQMAKAAQPARAQDTLLGTARIIEPLKSAGGDDAAEKPKGGLWPFAALFGRKQSSDQNLESSMHDDSPSLSASFSSDMDENSTSATSGASGASAMRKLKFNEQVEVCLIPKKEEYSKRIRCHLWHSPEEMALNAQRNTIEFAAEGWDWRNVMEDENMYRCLATNELIHPVHIEQLTHS
jgi:hypothetical protein